MTAATMRLMRKLFLFVLLTLSVAVYGRRISPEEATGIAKEFFNSASVSQQSPKTGVHRAQGRDASDAGGAPFYVFNADGDKGFVIVSGDDRVPRILGYSDKGSFDFDNMPPQLIAILDSCEVNINRLFETPHISWSAPVRDVVSDEKGRLLHTANWGQGYPYNLYTPEINGQHCPTGCVATAMAIVMKYNNWPQKSRGGIHKWISNGTEMRYDFDKQIFDFTKILDEYTDGEYTDEQAHEVSKLMQAAGSAVNMQYNPYASGAPGCVIGHYMHEYLQYSPLSQYISAVNFLQEEWLKLAFEQIDCNHPFILNAFADSEVGHTFVCDGYDENKMLHINWGWDGVSNGYFDPFLLGSYSNKISMAINLYNDGDTKEYSRAWADGGNLWARALIGTGPGFNISSENIKADEPFTIIIEVLTMPNDFNGNFGIALMDVDRNVIEIIEDTDHHYEGNHDFDNIGYTWSSCGGFRGNNISFHTEIKSDMRLQLMAREDGQSWKEVLGTIEAPTSCPVIGNKPNVSNIKWHIIDPDNLIHSVSTNNIETTEKEGADVIMYRDDWNISCSVSRGVSYIIIDNELRDGGSDFSKINNNFQALRDQYDVYVYAIGYEKLLNREVTLTRAGTLSSKIPMEEQSLVYRLKINGEMNADDYAFITSKLYSLKHLDVENTTIVESPENRANYMPASAGFIHPDDMGRKAWGLESIRLPTNLLGFECYSMQHVGIEFLEIPKSVIEYGPETVSSNGDRLDFLKVNNPVPSDLVGIGALDIAYGKRGNTILMVPSGSKMAYEASELWHGFKKIVESDAPFVGQYVDYEDCRYDVITDFAIVSGKYGDKSYCVLPNEIEYEGTKYPVKSCARHFQVNNLYVDNVENFTYTVNSIHVDNIFTNRLIPHVNILQLWEHTSCNLWVPGGVGNNYSNSYVYEMWSYKIDKNNKLLSIIPQCDLSIDKLIIDGKEVAVTNNGLYAFSDPENLKVELTYTLYGGQHTMTTTYPAEFNSKMESTELRVPCTSISLSPESWSGVEGESFQITATVMPEDATDKTLSWGSSDENIATVNASGLVSLIKQGSAVITASATDGSSVFAECNVVVSDGLGIADVSSDKSAYVRIFNMQGMQVYEGLYSEAKLVPDYYIISCNDKSLKVRVE